MSLLKWIRRRAEQKVEQHETSHPPNHVDSEIQDMLKREQESEHRVNALLQYARHLQEEEGR